MSFRELPWKFMEAVWKCLPWLPWKPEASASTEVPWKWMSFHGSSWKLVEATMEAVRCHLTKASTAASIGFHQLPPTSTEATVASVKVGGSNLLLPPTSTGLP